MPLNKHLQPSVGAALSCPPPLYRPSLTASSALQIILLPCIIAPAWANN